MLMPITLASALNEWEAECWEQYNHESDYDEVLEYAEEKGFIND